MRRFGFSAALAAAGIAASAFTAIPARAADMTSAAAQAAVQSAMAESKRGNLDGVIPLLDPVIAALETMQAKQSTFCAENMQQTLMITLGAAAKADKGVAPKGKAPKIGRSTVVVDQSFCIALFLKGFVLIDTGHPAEAEAFLRRAHEAEPYSAHFLNEYAEWYKAAGQWQRAHDLFADAVSLAEMADDADKAAFKARALRGMGFAEIELGKLDEAEKHMRESQKIDPANTAAQHELDYIASQRKRGRT